MCSTVKIDIHNQKGKTDINESKISKFVLLGHFKASTGVHFGLWPRQIFTLLVTLFISLKLHNRVYIDRKLSVNCNCTWVSTLTWADFFSVTQKCNGMEMEHIHWVYCRFLANAKRRIICEWKLTISGVHHTKQGRRSWVGRVPSGQLPTCLFACSLLKGDIYPSIFPAF